MIVHLLCSMIPFGIYVLIDALEVFMVQQRAPSSLYVNHWAIEMSIPKAEIRGWCVIYACDRSYYSPLGENSRSRYDRRNHVRVQNMQTIPLTSRQPGPG
ncbi:hypothetical protein PILCRDRAFT_682697 [Piloderma croceum F 1598]|uniref:Uncharacterized protein n=1 Tax=Piloderma croceum (strain F 1598) TaxID=765440 RepID=A0A0C3AMW3_PILCF|nr:hypothetical protein PILCRDRAFT_682697 [Piloderma croceum F 1598]